MNIAILCPGPSLTTTWTPDQVRLADLVIAVNNAGLLPHDWWQAHDHHSFERWGDLGNPRVGICSGPSTIGLYQNGGFALLRPGLKCQNWETLPKAPMRYGFSSGIGAMALAVHLGAKRCRVYGSDWEGTSDYTGEENAPGRSAHRWERERGAFDYLSEFWKDRTTFERVRP